MISNKYLRKVVDAYNRWIYRSRRRLGLTISGQELPDPKPRMLHRFGYNKIYALVKGLSKTMTIVGIKNTNSMEVIIDEGHLAIIEDKPNKDDLIVGDIILFFRVKDLNPRVLHRIIQIDSDRAGWYAICRGDNVIWDDGKIRYQDISGLCVGILY